MMDASGSQMRRATATMGAQVGGGDPEPVCERLSVQLQTLRYHFPALGHYFGAM